MGAGEVRPDFAIVIIILLPTATSEYKHKYARVHRGAHTDSQVHKLSP